MLTHAHNSQASKTAPADKSVGFSELLGAPVEVVRGAIRAGRYQSHTAGLAQGHLQCNLVILPQEDAADFDAYCARNPQACPLVGRGEPGDPTIPSLGPTIDIRTDVPRYHVYQEGQISETVTDLTAIWRDDLVIFALGCSFTFERALMDAGIAMRHVTEDKTVPMFISNRPTTPAGRFSGYMVVSMRPIALGDVERAVSISGRYPQAHGAPVHVGDPAELGIMELSKPDWGDPVTVEAGETPAFWACGVTPQVAIRAAKPALCITHAPGAMLITDLDEFQSLDDLAPPPLSASIITNKTYQEVPS